MDDERLRVADVGQVARQVDALDEAAPDGSTGLGFGAGDTEAEHRSRPLRQILGGTLVVRMRGEPRVVDELDARVGLQPLRHDLRILDMRGHPERQRLDALGELPRGLWREHRTDVAQLLGTQAREEGVLAEVAVPVEPAVVRHGLVEEREALVRPVEATGFDDDAAEGGPVAAEELGGRVDDDVGAPLDGAVEVRRRDRRVDDQRQVVGVGDLGQALEVGDLTGRVRDRLDEDELRLVGDDRCVVGRVGGVHERGLDAEAAQRHIELGDCAAVEARARHDVVAGSGERSEGDELGTEPGCRGHRPDPALERGDALLECCDRRVRQPAVDIAVLLQREAGGGIRGVVENEGAGLVDREGAGAGDAIRDVAGVDGAGAEAVFAVGSVGAAF